MKIALGTVQFGIDYGISNIHGQTSELKVRKILQYAQSSKISMLDTASLYGSSEHVIGNFTDNDYNWDIVTKTPQFSSAFINSTHVQKLKESFDRSLSRLNKKYLYGLLLHSCDDLLKPGGHLLFEEMERFRSIGLVEKIGVSLYSDNQINTVLDKFKIDLVQLPINIFSQKLLLNGWLKKLKDMNVEIHARSVFLQGLLLMDENLIPPYFSPIKNKFDEFYRFSKELGLSKIELALGFVNNIDEIDKIIVGVDNVDQLEEIVLASRVNIKKIDFSGIPIDYCKYTNPSLWKI